ncbi:hypothetical protein LIER_08224 [Lithospermum erythrorhizon]|uniref:Copper transporter n=1 Tax=Lithospermum erythrorhizon TaxID=34254 RepID=A0AAV3PCH4_LITER
MSRSVFVISDYYPPRSVNQQHSSYWASYLMTFFQGWPMIQEFSSYCFSICLVFFLGFAVEICSVLRTKQPPRGVFRAYIWDSLIHGTRMCLGYLIIVAIVSTDYSFLVAAALGHAIGNFMVNVYQYYSNKTEGNTIDTPE